MYRKSLRSFFRIYHLFNGAMTLRIFIFPRWSVKSKTFIPISLTTVPMILSSCAISMMQSAEILFPLTFIRSWYSLMQEFSASCEAEGTEKNRSRKLTDAKNAFTDIGIRLHVIEVDNGDIACRFFHFDGFNHCQGRIKRDFYDFV